jgi:hypothetical protein
LAKTILTCIDKTSSHRKGSLNELTKFWVRLSVAHARPSALLGDGSLVVDMAILPRTLVLAPITPSRSKSFCPMEST